MARDIDFSKPLNADDAQYVQERQWLIRDALNAGLEVTYADADETDTEEGSDTEEVVETYNDWTVQQLTDEIEARNAQLDEDSQIEPAGKKKADLVAALEADDASAEDDDDAEEDAAE